jgi:hypothetical protein
MFYYGFMLVYIVCTIVYDFVFGYACLVCLLFCVVCDDVYDFFCFVYVFYAILKCINWDEKLCSCTDMKNDHTHIQIS